MPTARRRLCLARVFAYLRFFKEFSMFKSHLVSIVSLASVACVVHAQPTRFQNQPQPAPVAVQPTPVQPAPVEPAPAGKPIATPVVAAPSASPEVPVLFVGAGGLPSVVSIGNFDANAAADPTPALPFQEIAPLPEPPVEIKALSADGRPTEFKAGSADALYLWQDAKGTRWHVRTTTKGQWHRFHGVITGESAITGVRATRTEWNDRVRATPQRVAFDLVTRGATDGFDFNVAGDKCIRVTVIVDGRRQADKIKLGAAATSPQHAHFRICP
jgi:hypothetical protein